MAAGHDGVFLAGTGRSEITPAPGGWLDGLGLRERPSTSVHDPLYATALALACGKERAIWLSADILALTLEQAGCVRNRIAKEAGIPAAMVMLAATHTHSGPATGVLQGLDQDPAWWEVFTAGCVAAAREALDGMAPARVGLGEGRSNLGVNRRDYLRGTDVPPGFVDREVRLLYLVGKGETPVAAVVNHACHPVMLGPENLEISADFIGVVRREVEAALPGCRCLYLNGAAGDVNPRVGMGNDPGTVEREGGALAAEVLRVLAGIEFVACPSLAGKEAMADLPLAPPPPRGELIDRIERIRRKYETLISGDSTVGGRRFAATELGWAERTYRAMLAGEIPTAITVPLQAFRLGDICALFAAPFEVLSSVGAAIKRNTHGRPPLFFAGYANGCLGYLPGPDDITLGGYEVEEAFKWYGQVAGFAPGAAGIIVKEAGHMLAGLFAEA